MKILEAAIKKRSSKQQHSPMDSETKEKLEYLFQKATESNSSTSKTTTELIQAHAELHRKSAPPITL